MKKGKRRFYPKILVLGLGVSGRSAAALAVSRGFEVIGIDESEDLSPDGLDGVSVISGWKKGDAFPEHDLIVLSPGVAPYSPLGAAALHSGAPIVGELDFAFQFLDAPVLAVTGTNGKTTTTEMTVGIIGDSAVAAGNIGNPLSEVALEEWRGPVVVEASSFQLERTTTFAPKAATLLNVSSDHMDRYDSFDDYQAAKFAVFRNIAESRMCVLNHSLLPEWTRLTGEGRGMPVAFSVSDGAADIVLDGSTVHFKTFPLPPIDLSGSKVRGAHNIENFMAAVALASAVLAPEALLDGAIKLSRSFRLAPHRQELVAEIAGVRFVNDSKATNPDSLFAALDVFGGFRNIILIAGGLDKDMDFSISPKYVEMIRRAFLVGAAAARIEDVWGGAGVDCLVEPLFEIAVRSAVSLAEPGDVVLLSPACASMDMFANYKERGDFFREIILQTALE